MNGRVAKALRSVAQAVATIEQSYVQHRGHGQIRLKQGCPRHLYKRLKGNYYAKRKESAFG